MRFDDLTPSEHRQRCYTCFRPIDRCFCHAIPNVANRTRITMIQHVKERFHAFNSARIVKSALQNCDLHVGQMHELEALRLHDRRRIAVLYPSEQAIQLQDLEPEQQPEHLVVLDGTWHHARKLIRLPGLQGLMHVRLNPKQPSNYRIRKEPTAFALSTLEATVACLKIIEPTTTGLNDLLSAFDTMIEGQLKHSQQQARYRKSSSNKKAIGNIPRLLEHSPEKIVVCYAESVRNGGHAEPVVVVAQRLIDATYFQCIVQTKKPVTSVLQQHFQLSADDLHSAIPYSQFQHAWNQFLRPDDVVAAYNVGTLTCLHVPADRQLILKSIQIGRANASLDEKLSENHVEIQQEPMFSGRASRRLANALAWTNYLQQRISAYGNKRTF